MQYVIGQLDVIVDVTNIGCYWPPGKWPGAGRPLDHAGVSQALDIVSQRQVAWRNSWTSPRLITPYQCEYGQNAASGWQC